MLKLVPTLLLMAGIAATPLLAAAEPAPDQRYAAIFPPGWDQRDIILATSDTEQAPLAFGRAANIGIFILETDGDRSAVRQSGAWLILPAAAFNGCLSGPDTRVASDRRQIEERSS